MPNRLSDRHRLLDRSSSGHLTRFHHFEKWPEPATPLSDGLRPVFRTDREGPIDGFEKIERPDVFAFEKNDERFEAIGPCDSILCAGNFVSGDAAINHGGDLIDVCPRTNLALAFRALLDRRVGNGIGDHTAGFSNPFVNRMSHGSEIQEDGRVVSVKKDVSRFDVAVKTVFGVGMLDSVQ